MMLSEQEIMAEFEAAEAILRGHFILSSGLHSDTYLQCARVLMNPRRAEKLCADLAERVKLSLVAAKTLSPWGRGSNEVRGEGVLLENSASTSPLTQPSPPRGEGLIDLVVAPAMGGVVVGYEMGRQLGVETIFCERENGQFALRRGFRLEVGARVLMVEDVVTTGKSSMEAVACVEAAGGVVVAEASLIDRSNGGHNLPFPLISLLKVDVKTYQPDALPAHLVGTEAVKPGSRFLKK
jgi:orotate phosphoribosyltransferase